jgi:hypothetical protein
MAKGKKKRKKIPVESREHNGLKAPGLFLLGSILLFHLVFTVKYAFHGFWIAIGLVEGFTVPIVWLWAGWRAVVWWHDRPRNLGSFADDPGLIS